MTDVITISGIEGYEKDGVVFLKLETVARGLGFTTVATSGNEVVRWARVAKYLADLGVEIADTRKVAECRDACPEYIPENIFYRLAMKANNDTATRFQEKVANEVIPSIRKSGYYAVSGLATLPPAVYEALHSVNARLDTIEGYIVKAGQIARSNQRTLGYIGYGMRRDRTAGKVTRWQMKAKKKFKAIAEYLGVEDRTVLKSLYDMMEDEFDFDMNDYLDEYKYVNNLDKCSGFTVVCTYKELRQRFDAVIDSMLEQLGLEVDTTLPRRKTIFDDYLTEQVESEAIG